MLDLSLHVLDIVENAVRARARAVWIRIAEDRSEDLLTLTIEDDGEGMDPLTLKKAADPFFTTQSKKKTGLGLSLLAQSAKEAEGKLTLKSRKGAGTQVTATFRLSHIDLRPLGDMETTLKCLRATHPEITFHYEYSTRVGGDGGEVNPHGPRLW